MPDSALPQFTSLDLQQFIGQHHISATILPMTEHTPTVPDAARALGVAEAQIIKSLVFLIKGQPVLVINNGTARVDPRKLAAHFETNRKKVKFAKPEQALDITGYIVGSMPPFGHRQPLPTFVDPAATQFEVVYGGGGDIDAMLRLTPTELLRVTQATLLNVSR